TLAQHDLVDEYHLLLYPIVLGGGKQVFANGTPLNLRLVEARPLPSGVVLTHYAVERNA
ncbi:MAG: dihydrofolate reductase family protein, partial [Chloroflexota bacterium]|nr:dihydrofolate reductase family protein [Chloroflexota bacterium]